MQNWCLQKVDTINAASTECVQWITEMTKKECLYSNSQERMELMASEYSAAESHVVIQFLLMNQFQQTGFLASVATVLDFFSNTVCKAAFYNSLPAIRQLPSESVLQLLRESFLVCFQKRRVSSLAVLFSDQGHSRSVHMKTESNVINDTIEEKKKRLEELRRMREQRAA